MALVTGWLYRQTAYWDVRRLNHIAAKIASDGTAAGGINLFEVAPSVQYGPLAASVAFAAAIALVIVLFK